MRFEQSHIGICVSDLEKSLAFYRDGLGFEDGADFDPADRAVYSARVVERPSCRYSWRDCPSLPEDERPETCGDPTIPRTIRERAWTSPIGYAP